LDDEDIAQVIQLKMTGVTKGGLIKASDVVNVVVSPRLQEFFKQIRIFKPSISEQTAHRWLGKLGWHYSQHPSGLYTDGHEHKDVIKYQCEFIDRWVTYENHFQLNNDRLPLSLRLPLRQPTPGLL
jgi:hypothetical protein